MLESQRVDRRERRLFQDRLLPRLSRTEAVEGVRGGERERILIAGIIGDERMTPLRELRKRPRLRSDFQVLIERCSAGSARLIDWSGRRQVHEVRKNAWAAVNQPSHKFQQDLKFRPSRRSGRHRRQAKIIGDPEPALYQLRLDNERGLDPKDGVAREVGVPGDEEVGDQRAVPRGRD